MTKFVGTGKDPRAPEGVDLDIPDARPHEADLVEESGIGTRVPDDETHLVPHTGQEIIAAEGGVPEVVAEGEPGVGSHVDRVAARVETTSANPEGEGSEDGSSDEDLDGLNREELNARAESAGVENPKGLSTKADVIDAIRTKESGAE